MSSSSSVGSTVVGYRAFRFVNTENDGFQIVYSDYTGTYYPATLVSNAFPALNAPVRNGPPMCVVPCPLPRKLQHCFFDGVQVRAHGAGVVDDDDEARELLGIRLGHEDQEEDEGLPESDFDGDDDDDDDDDDGSDKYEMNKKNSTKTWSFGGSNDSAANSRIRLRNTSRRDQHPVVPPNSAGAQSQQQQPEQQPNQRRSSSRQQPQDHQQPHAQQQLNEQPKSKKKQNKPCTSGFHAKYNVGAARLAGPGCCYCSVCHVLETLFNNVSPDCSYDHAPTVGKVKSALGKNFPIDCKHALVKLDERNARAVVELEELNEKHK